MILNILNKRLAYHFYFWGCVFFGFFMLTRMMTGTTGEALLYASFYSLLQAVPVYCHFLILKKFFNYKKYLAYILTSAAVFVFSGSLNCFLLRTFFNDKNKFLAYYIHVLLFLIITTALKFLKNDLRQTLKVQEIETRQIEEELTTLKRKISPDFVLQELSKLHTLSLNKSGKVPGLILQLSDYMRQLLNKPKPQPGNTTATLSFENRKIPGILNTRLAWYIYFYCFLFFLIFFPWGAADVFTKKRVYDFFYFFALTLPSYPHFFLLERFMKKNFLLYLVMSIFIIGLSAISYKYVFSALFEHGAGVLQWAIEIIFTVVVTIAIKTVKDGFKQRVRLQEIKARHLQSELNLLKSQVNPHFFFNTLNNLYSLSLDSSEKLPEMTQKFRDLIAYMLESSKKETVDLEQERDFLENYISLEKLRLSENCHIKMNVTGDSQDKLIAPMLLIPFVENSFKHGVIASDDFFVSVDLKIEENTLTFTVENSLPLHPGSKNRPPSTKSGLKNVTRRLELLYPERHNLIVKEQGETFAVTLEIKL